MGIGNSAIVAIIAMVFLVGRVSSTLGDCMFDDGIDVRVIPSYEP